MPLRKRFIGIGLVAAAFITLSTAAKLYPEILWFDSFGFKNIWWLVFNAKLAMFSLGFALAFLFLFANIQLARRFSKSTPNTGRVDFPGPLQFLNQILRSYETSPTIDIRPIKQIGGRLAIGLAVGLSILFGLVAKAQWELVWRAWHTIPFGTTDPIFNNDISFYLLTLPIIKFLQSWVFMLVLVGTGLVVWIYLTQRLVIYIFSTQAGPAGIKPHIFTLLGLLCGLVGARVWISIIDMLYSSRGAVFGAGHADIFAQWTAYKLLMILVFVLALTLIWSGFRKSLRAPGLVLGALVVVYLVMGQIYPGIVQNYVVAPNELAKEKPFIEHNIRYTRLAYNLDKINETKYPVAHNLTAKTIEENPNIINNIRLWNQEPLQQTFSQLQEIRLYYEFHNIDVDRYPINGALQQVMLSPRELDTSQLTSQAQTWTNRHLVYTHGYGVCMSPVNKVTSEGLPYFYIKDLPPVSTIDVQVTRPEIYYGEKTSDYIIVNTDQEEFDYPRGDTNVYTNYQGQGGIKLDSFFKRLIFAMKFSDLKILISPLIKSESRLIYDRNIRTIANILAPFVIFDQDPYLVIDQKGNLVWMLDGYTISDQFPYSEPFNGRYNYIRNSVKATINAYSGETRFYVVDNQDPLIAAYKGLYKGLLQPFNDMPADLKAHIRYPKGLFSVQAKMYNTYHMTDPQVFYNREDLWGIPSETYVDQEQTMRPYYMVTKLPGDQSESFVLMQPFTPTNKNNMISWMAAKCDLDEYGNITVFKFPKERTIYGPMQIESRIDQDTEISQKLTLWGQMGSRVIRGNLMVVPIEDSLIYVEPIYLQATQSKLPELKRVIFAYNDHVVMEENLNAAISAVFEGAHIQDTVTDSTTSKPQTKGSLAKRISAAYRELKKVAGQNDWVSFGKTLQKLGGLIDNLQTTPEGK